MTEKKDTGLQSGLERWLAGQDRVGQYFMKYMDRFIFDELSPSHLAKEGLGSFMKNVPVPFREEDLAAFKEKGGLKITSILSNMAWVLGIHPDFMYADEYKKYIDHYFDDRLAAALVGEAAGEMEKQNLDSAFIHFRAALVLYPDYKDALFGYAGVCRSIYLNREGDEDRSEEYVGRFKAESMETFERLTVLYPEFDRPFYYLGYAYLNMGLYKKAELTWKEYLKLAKGPNSTCEEGGAEAIEEIEERVRQLQEPIRIEEGCNCVLSGRFQDGIEILKPFLETDYKHWWPLFYYLGIAYGKLGEYNRAIELLKEALVQEPSQTDCMEELILICREAGRDDLAEKYENKLKLIQSQRAQ